MNILNWHIYENTIHLGDTKYQTGIYQMNNARKMMHMTFRVIPVAHRLIDVNRCRCFYTETVCSCD